MVNIEEVKTARNDFYQQMIKLENALGEIEKQHYSTLLQLDAKSKENDQHLGHIKDRLVGELHLLKDEINAGREKVYIYIYIY